MPKGVKFYYIYKSLAHPESSGYVQPFTLEERLLHVKEAETRIDGRINWLCDTIGNDVMHALGNAPTSEFVINPEGKIARKRAWGNVRDLRKDLEELVGPIENPTKVSDLDLKIAPPPKQAAKGIVERVKAPNGMKPLVARPEIVGLTRNSAIGGTPYYAKLRADGDQSLLKTGTGMLYLGFHLDPIYRVHWNNLTDPIHVEVESPGGVRIPASLDGPRVEEESDADPREFLVDVSGWTSDKPLRLTVRYFGCSDEPAFCVPVTQHYTIDRKLDIDSGWAKGRIDPTGDFQPMRPKIAEGIVVKIDEKAGTLAIDSGDGEPREFLVDRETHYYRGTERRPLREMKEETLIRVEFFVREEGPRARQVRTKADKPNQKPVAATATAGKQSDGKKAVFGYVVSMDVAKRVLTFKTDAGQMMKVRIADNVDFRRLDGKPNKLETLEEGHKVRVEYEPPDDGLPVVKRLLARVLPPTGSSRPQTTDRKPTSRGRGTFEARDRYNPRRAIVWPPTRWRPYGSQKATHRA